MERIPRRLGVGTSYGSSAAEPREIMDCVPKREDDGASSGEERPKHSQGRTSPQIRSFSNSCRASRARITRILRALMPVSSSSAISS